MVDDADETHLRRAIALAAANLGLTGDNPSVGCVIVRDSVVVGEGATAPGGRTHAEERALDAAGERAKGGTAYVTLEPCAERSAGHTACSLRLVEAQVARVVIACIDRSVMAGGQGPALLREAGVAVETGLLAEEAARLYANYRPRQG